MDIKEVFEEVAEIYPEVMLADGFDAACIGLAAGVTATRLVYDRRKCLEILKDRDGMTEEEAEEFFSFNVEGAYVGESTPVFFESWAERFG
jgi:hypothetical protein